MKSTQNKYTKEQFVKDFLRMQALKNAKTKREKVEYHNPIESIVDIEESANAILDKYDVKTINESANEEVDLTDVKEVYEMKTVTGEPQKVVELNPIKSITEEFDNCKTVSIEDVKAAIEDESELFKNNRDIVFEINVEYTSNDLSFNGLNLLEEKLRDGNLQIGFDVNAGTFVGDTITKIVRKRKQRVKFEDVYAQLSFE